MRIRDRYYSKKSIALILAAILLFAAGGITGTRAAMVTSTNYDMGFSMDAISVSLVENGNDLGKNGTLMSGMSGQVITPGKKYDDVITAANTGSRPEYVRMIVRKYWTYEGEDSEGNPISVKSTDLSPDLIHMTGKSGKWMLGEQTTEMQIYYYRDILEPGASSEPLCRTVSVDGSVAKIKNVEEHKSGDTTTYNYYYRYNGYSFNLEAEVQAIQTHSAQEAIESLWGVGNVSVSGDQLSVE